MRYESWSTEEDEILRKLRVESRSYSYIADYLSNLFSPRTENAIKKRAFNLGLAGRDMRVVKMPTIIDPSAPPFKTLDISIMELNNNTCRAMTGDKTYCGHTRAEHSKSYCRWHHDRYYARSIKGDYNVV